MKKLILVVFILLSLIYSNYSYAQKSGFDALFQGFLKSYSAGDLLSAEKSLNSITKSEISLKTNQIIAVYNNLGVVSMALGNYDKALSYNFKAETFVTNNDHNSQYLADIFNNRGNLFNIKKSFDVAIEYLEKSIRIYGNLGFENSIVLENLSSAYINISIAYIETKKYSLALEYLEKNVTLNKKFGLFGLSLTYLNMAKTYVKMGNLKKAEEFYLRSIESFVTEYNKDYYRLAEVYFDYGLFLRSEGKTGEALSAHQKSFAICLKNYGSKHTLVALSLKHIGDDYLSMDRIDSALSYYQKSLIAVDRNFNNPDIYANPSIDSSLFDIRLLDNLKSKAQALELYSGSSKDPETQHKNLSKALETIELALQLIDRIRNNYLSEESRMYLAENEKETYLFATHLAWELYSATNEKAMGERMYDIAQKAKAAILRNDITGNELLYSAGIPDSLREEQNLLSGNIAAYNNLVLDETRKTKPDSNKIALWKDALFDMNRHKEKVTARIEQVFPQYHDLIRKTEPVSLQVIQNKLNKNEVIIDYLLSNQYSGGQRKLFIFLISPKSLDFREILLDSLFARNADLLRKISDPSLVQGLSDDYFKSSTEALNYMYLSLIKPVEHHIRCKRLIIIPDEEISWLSFDSFLKTRPVKDQSGYEGLDYLIKDYTFSYGYSSSLISGGKESRIGGVKVFAFSPEYRDSFLPGKEFSTLKGAGEEIGSIFKWFRGKSFTGEKATKSNFMTVLQDPAIFHLAMHSMTDSLNSRYSYLMFDTQNLSSEQGKLFNYEISLTHIKSPMVVLSACNSGGGTLYSGEGLMSLARGFTLAGASSVIKTAWEINDETSRAIITLFYRYLAKGEDKDEAMRHAKLDYLKNSSPAFTNPYYWAAYEVLGDNAPVTHNRTRSMILVSLVVIISAGLFLVYLRRRRIFSDRSR